MSNVTDEGAAVPETATAETPHKHRSGLRRSRKRRSASEKPKEGVQRNRWQTLPYALRQKIIFWSVGLGSGLFVVLVLLRYANSFGE